jgi:hypothetical protein
MFSAHYDGIKLTPKWNTFLLRLILGFPRGSSFMFLLFGISAVWSGPHHVLLLLTPQSSVHSATCFIIKEELCILAT